MSAEAAVSVLAIDVAQRRGECDPPLFEIAERIGKGIRARPPHASKRCKEPRAAPQADEPIATVWRAPEHRIGIAEEPKGACDLGGADGRNVATDDDHGPWRQALEEALHAAPEIAVALGQSGDPPRPNRLEPKRCGDVGVGGDREQGAPSRATAKPQQSMGEASASEARGGSDANAAREPLLDAPRPRAFGHDDQARRVGGAATTSLITHKGAQARVRAREGNRE